MTRYLGYWLYVFIGPLRLRRIWGFIGLAACLTPFWLLGMPWYADAAFALFALYLAVKGCRAELALIALSLSGALAIASVVYQNTLPKQETRTYFRPDDMYWGGSRPNTFQANVDVVFPMPHGDMGGALPRALLQPRTVRFKTDELGWRNDAPYAGQPVVVIGDSFVVGTGNSQEETLAGVLTRKLGLPAYSASFPVTPQDYFDIGQDFLRQTGADADMYMFIFEGNDFNVGSCQVSSDIVVPSPYAAFKFSVAYRLGKTCALFPFLVNFWSRTEAVLLGRMQQAVMVAKAGGHSIAFLSAYANVSSCPELKLLVDRPHPEVLARLKGVFFVPTKYRVYQPLLDEQVAAPPAEPSPGLSALHAVFDAKGVPVVDLTPRLREAAKQALSRGRLIYWRDDTHWNHEAIQSAASAVVELRGR